MPRSAARAARPTSSIRVFRPSSSSMTVSGTTMSTASKALKQSGSAISTEVSSTTRARCSTAAPMSRSTAGSVRRSVR